jgi:tRNA(Ile2) C34 agmatinyltransferase TiaS
MLSREPYILIVDNNAFKQKGFMRVYIGFDDTDFVDSDYGTGKVARRFAQVLPEGCKIWGVVRQQLLVDPAIPYTSHNSSACVVVDCPDSSYIEVLKSAAIKHIEDVSIPGSDPGLCLAEENDPAVSELKRFGLLCTAKVVS